MTVQAQGGGTGTSSGAGASGEGGSAGAGGGTGTSAGAGASGGGAAGAGAGASGSAGGSGTSAGAGAGDQGGGDLKGLQAEVARLTARESELKGLLNDAVGRRQATSTEHETTKSELAKSTAALQKAEGQLRQRQTIDAVTKEVPLANRQASIDALYRLHAEGAFDLGAEDREATLKNVAERLKKDYPKYFEEPASGPNIPGAGGVRTSKIGSYNDQGERVL